MLRLCEIDLGPLQLSDMWNGWARRFLSGFRLRHCRSDPDVALQARVWSTGTKCIEWIDCEWKRLKLNINRLNCLCCRVFVDRRHSQNRLAVVQRFQRERFLAQRIRFDRDAK